MARFKFALPGLRLHLQVGVELFGKFGFMCYVLVVCVCLCIGSSALCCCSLYVSMKCVCSCCDFIVLLFVVGLYRGFGNQGLGNMDFCIEA